MFSHDQWSALRNLQCQESCYLQSLQYTLRGEAHRLRTCSTDYCGAPPTYLHVQSNRN